VTIRRQGNKGEELSRCWCSARRCQSVPTKSENRIDHRRQKSHQKASPSGKCMKSEGQAAMNESYGSPRGIRWQRQRKRDQPHSKETDNENEPAAALIQPSCVTVYNIFNSSGRICPSHHRRSSSYKDICALIETISSRLQQTPRHRHGSMLQQTNSDRAAACSCRDTVPLHSPAVLERCKAVCRRDAWSRRATTLLFAPFQALRLGSSGQS